MARFDFMKYVEDGHLQRDAAAAAARAKQEAKALGLPPAGLSKDGKRMLSERKAPVPSRVPRERAL